MSDEHQSIRALHMYADRLRDRNAPPVTKRDWTGDCIPVPWGGKGSDNRPPLAWANELFWWAEGSNGHREAVDWWKDWCEFEDNPAIGFEGRELGSRIYDSWMTCAAVMALNAPGIGTTLESLLRKHLRRLWLMQSLGAVPESQGQSWYSGPSVTWCGMRSVSKDGKAEIRGVNNEIDTMFAMATGMNYRYNRFANSTGPAICFKLDMGLSEDEKIPMRDCVNREIGPHALLGFFTEDLETLVTRVPITFHRWDDGSAGTLILQDIGVSTPPVYGCIMYRKSSQPAAYLVTHLPGDNPKHYVHGFAKEEVSIWIANAERVMSISLPPANRTFTMRVDKAGVSIGGDPVEPPIDPPIDPPVEPPVDPPVDPGESVMYHLDSAMKQYEWNNKQASLDHTRRAETLLEEEIG